MSAIFSPPPPHLLPKLRSDEVMDAMQEFPCNLRISSMVPGHRCASRETVVGVHLFAFGKGTGTKFTDLCVAAGCLHCHMLIDRVDGRIRDIEAERPMELVKRIVSGLVETHTMLAMKGIIVVPKGEWI